MVAASYGAVYGALLDDATRYYVFDAIAMRERAFLIAKGSNHREVPVTSADHEQGLKVIRETVGEISRFFGFPTSPGSAP
jgi:hypothetical protein